MLKPGFRAVVGKQDYGGAMVACIPDRIMKLFPPCGKLASLSVLAAMVIFCALSKPADAQQTQGIAAQVDDDVITRLDLVARTNFIILTSRQRNSKEVRKRVKRQALDQLIDEMLKFQEARRLKFTVSRKELKSAMRTVEARNKMNPGDMSKLLIEHGIDKTTFEKQIEAELLWSKIIRRLALATIKNSEVAIKDAIAVMRANKGKPEYLAAEIFIPFESNKSALETKQMVGRLHRQIVEGARFSALARTFSQSASAAKGGSMGWIRADQLEKNLAIVIARLKPGQMSAPIQVPDGYYILLLQNQRVAAGLPQPNVTVNLQQVFLPLTQKASKTELNTQLNLAKSIAKTTSGCQNLDNVGKEMGSPQSGKLDNIKLDRLPQNIRSAIQDLGIGEASNPVQIAAGILVVMVCKKTGQATEAQIRQQVSLRLSERRARLLARRLIRDLRNSTYVDKRN